MDDFQKAFYMYLSALSPSFDVLAQFCQCELKLREIERTDYRKKLSHPEEVLETTAEYLGISKEEYIKKLAEEMKEQEKLKVKETYGFLTEEERKKQLEKKKDIERKINDFVKQFNEQI